jgi:hypothetical protein
MKNYRTWSDLKADRLPWWQVTFCWTAVVILFTALAWWAR